MEQPKPEYRPTPDMPMSETELKAAELMMRCGDITGEDLCWLMGLTDEKEDRPPPRGFKSWSHFNAFKWHQEQRAMGRRPPKRRRKRAA